MPPFAAPAFAGVVAAVVIVGARGHDGAPAHHLDDQRLAAALSAVVERFDDTVDGGGRPLRLPLSDAEEQLFAHHAIAAGKRRLAGAHGDGELLVVVARSLRALHAPERCLAGSGHAVAAVDVVVRGGVDVKRLLLDGGDNVALSLLRSPTTQAATLGDVARARLRGDTGPWVFVSAVVKNDGAVDEDALARALVDDAGRVLSPLDAPPAPSRSAVSGDS